jgi:hypothetical protein
MVATFEIPAFSQIMIISCVVERDSLYNLTSYFILRVACRAYVLFARHEKPKIFLPADVGCSRGVTCRSAK